MWLINRSFIRWVENKIFQPILSSHHYVVLVFFSMFFMACSSEHPKLVQAAYKNNNQTLFRLLREGADPNEHSTKSRAHTPSNYPTALSVAAQVGNTYGVKLLLQYNADRHKTTRGGHLPIELALTRRHFETAKVIWEHEAHAGYVPHGAKLLSISVNNNDEASFDYFRSQLKGIRYIRNIYSILAGYSSLSHESSRISAERIISFLMKKNVKPSPESLVAVLRRGHPKVIEMLIEAGADPNQRIDLSYVDFNKGSSRYWSLLDGNTALMALTHPNYIETAQALIDAGADVNATNVKGQTALMHFVANTYLSNKEVMKKKDPHPSYTSIPSGRFKHGQLPIFEFYLNNGARTDLKDSKGRTLLDLINPDDIDAEYKRKFLSKKNRGQSLTK